MAQGGTIPTDRAQTVTFYNTTGIIEKEKGIYLSPRFKNTNYAGYEVREAYLQILDSEAVKDPDYTNIMISSWSPQDRRLIVKGNIDDFRLVTDEGDCLNYLVVTREVIKGGSSNIYYYGFFITDVQQAGGSSIRLTLEPDDFTNIFYLHNEHTLTSAETTTTDYDPFNERMKNCHVNRQHYNRVRITEKQYVLKAWFDRVASGLELVEGQPIEVEFTDDLGGTHISGTVRYFDDRDYQDFNTLYIEILTDEEEAIGSSENWSTIYYGGNQYQCDYDVNDLSWLELSNIVPDNLRIFLNQEESFKFKYQYRDEKYPYLFSKDELAIIKRTGSFSSLSNDMKCKVLQASLSFLVIETKSTELFVPYAYVNIPNVETIYTQVKQVKNGNMISDKFNRPNGVIAFPFYDVPELLKKYEDDILSNDVYGYFWRTDFQKYIKLTPASEVFKTINTKAIADWIYSAYIVRDILLWDRHIKFQNGKFVIYMDTPSYIKPLNNSIVQDAEIDKNIFFAGITNDPESIGQITELHRIRIQWGDTTGSQDTYFFSSGCLLGIMVSGFDHKTISLEINETIPNLKNNYYDPVLETEPYSFYSISFLNFELPFNKNRYYVGLNSTISLKYYMSVNGAIKCGLIPLYSVDNKEYLYFNEGMVFTIDSALPLSSDSYSSYYYVNKAQMKNQFAVNEYNRKVDLAQHFFLSGPNAVGQTAFKRGGYGAIAETINQVTQMGDEMIDWAQSTKVIEMNQKAKLADVGAQPDALKQTGTDALYDLATNEGNFYINHYTIDSISYNSIGKFLERFGYQINLYDSLHTNDRVGWNYIKLNSFDWNPAYDIMVGQEENLRKIFSNGVTLLHDKSYLTSGHNYETILDE